MVGASGRLRAWVDARRAMAGGVAAAVVLPAIVVLASASGAPRTKVELSGGGAWLASPTQGLVTLIDGPSDQVVGAVRAPGAQPGDDLSVVQQDSSAYVVNPVQGTVSRVDGRTYEVSTPVRFGDGGRNAPLQVYPGQAGSYIVDGQRRVASIVDPVSLRVRDRLALTAQPGPGQSVVDSAGRLWVVGASGLAWFDGSGQHVRPELGGARARLVLLDGRPVLVDLANSRVGRLTGDGQVSSWSCLELPAGAPTPALLGSAALGRVLAAIPSTGTLVASGDGNDDCGVTVDVGKPGDTFGALVEVGGFVFVPDRSQGRTTVVDLSARRVVAQLDVVKPGAALELLAKDGLVFYNDLGGDEAGVIRFDGGRWQAGKVLRKFSPGQNGAKILTPAGAHPQRPNPPPGQRPPGQQPPGQQPPGQQPPGQQPPGQQPPGQQPPGQQPPGGNPPGNPPPTTPPVSPPPQSPGSPPPVTVTVQVVGDGSVTADHPAPLNAAAGAQCAARSNCAFEYAAGTTAVLRIPNAPSPDVLLGSVTGCTSKPVSGGDTLCNVVVTRAATVIATFVPKPPVKVTLAVTVTGSGSVTATPAGGAATPCAPTCSLLVVAGTTVDLVAAAGNGSYLSDWTTAGCAPSAASCPVTVAADTNITVAFAPLLTLTVQTAGSGTGTVTGTGLTCGGATCTGTYRAGDAVSLAAAPGAHSAFSSWSGCAPANSPNCSLTMTANTTVTATFTDTLPTVQVGGNGQTATTTNGASVSLSGSATVIDVFVTVDSFFPIRSIELDNNFSDTCTDGHTARNDPARFDSASINTGFNKLGYHLDMPALACGTASSLPTLERGNFSLTAKVTTDQGTVTTQPFNVSYTQ